MTDQLRDELAKAIADATKQATDEYQVADACLSIITPLLDKAREEAALIADEWDKNCGDEIRELKGKPL